MLFDFGLSTIYILDMSRQARATKAKINKWDYIKLKTFCTVKEIKATMRYHFIHVRMAIIKKTTTDKGW